MGYSKNVKGYRLLQPNSKRIIIRRGVKFNENVFAYEPDSAYVPSSECEPNLVVVPSSSSILNNAPSDISSDTKSDNEHPPQYVSPPDPTPMTTSQLPRWVHYSRSSW